jgi:hypothetical protein
VDGARLGNRRRRHGDHHCRLALGESRVRIAAYTLLPFGSGVSHINDQPGEPDLKSFRYVLTDLR